MLKSTPFAMLVMLLFMASCGSKNHNKKNMQSSDNSDVHSYARPHDVSVKHLDLDLLVNFDRKILEGSATLHIENHTKADTLYLDSRYLYITKVLLDDGSETPFILGPEDKILGRQLAVHIKQQTMKVTIYYQTTEGAEAVQWLTPEQTAGKKHPFLFTQSQAILARTWIPLQDSPGIRFTYNATIRCPENLMVLMSAENDTALHPDGIYHFSMKQPIPSYLMALTVGDIRFHAYDNRSGVYAEPETIEKAAEEFTDMPKMIAAAEELYGPYQWGRYDVIVLPPSFPFGGMENPLLTFATPTIIAGDKSLVALIAHELAHSWSGNLVTNATWNDFWLNEGFTVYFETRIMEKLYGKDYADMLTVLSKGELDQTIEEMGNGNADTKLFLNLKGRNPDDGMNDIAYEKGRFFLTTIEYAVGRERWDAFLKSYFKEHAFQSMTTDSFLKYLREKLIAGDAALENKIRINDWVFGAGLPDNCPVITSVELNKAGAESARFENGTGAADLNTQGWTTHHWLYFLRQVQGKIGISQLRDIDHVYHLTQSNNSEVVCEWFQLCIENGYKEANPQIENFLVHVGRRKFVRPLFAALLKTPDGKAFADEIYKKARPGYHAVTVATIDEMLQWNKH